MTTAALSARGLAVGYASGRRRRRVLAGLDLDLRPGELVCLLGPNGAGKSTLLRTLAGLQEPLEGKLEWEGRDVAAFTRADWAKRLAVVLTDRAEVGNMSVYALASLGRHPFTDRTGRLGPGDRAAVDRALQAAGAWDLRDRACDELSDGERQKAMVARALAQDPALLVLDEPTAFLNLPRRVEIMRVLRGLARAGRAVVLSTHDLDLAMRAADRLWLLPPGGPLLTGLPEDLVLQGHFSAVFDQGDVVFDPANGQFRVHAHPTARAELTGDPALCFWTARALEREGYSVSAAGTSPEADRAAPLPVTLRLLASRVAGKPGWEILDGGRRFGSMEELVAALRLQHQSRPVLLS